MSRGRLLVALGILFGHSTLALGQAIQPVQQLPRIPTVATDTLPDLARAVADPDRPVIYYNPRLMARFGPEISAFVLAHELAHIALGHARPSPGRALTETEKGELERLLRSWELEADCVAAIRLSRERPAALSAAIQFFEQMGESRIDAEHPTGAARAERLNSCGRSWVGGPLLRGEAPHPRFRGLRFR